MGKFVSPGFVGRELTGENVGRDDGEILRIVGVIEGIDEGIARGFAVGNRLGAPVGNTWGLKDG